MKPMCKILVINCITNSCIRNSCVIGKALITCSLKMTQ